MTPSGRTSAPRSYDAPARDRVLAAVEFCAGLDAPLTAAGLAEHLGLARRTVRGHLAELEDLGLIARDPIRVTGRRP